MSLKHQVFWFFRGLSDDLDTMYQEYGLLNLITIFTFCMITLCLAVKKYYVYSFFTLLTVFSFEIFQEKFTVTLRVMYLYFTLVAGYATIFTDSAGVLEFFILYNCLLLLENCFKVAAGESVLGISRRGSTLCLASFILLTLGFIFIDPSLKIHGIFSDSISFCSGEDEETEPPIVALYAKLHNGLETPSLDLMSYSLAKSLKVGFGLAVVRTCFLSTSFLLEHKTAVQGYLYKKPLFLPAILRGGLSKSYSAVILSTGLLGLGIGGEIVGTYLFDYFSVNPPSLERPTTMPGCNKHEPTYQEVFKDLLDKATGGKLPTGNVEKPLDSTPGSNLPDEGKLTASKLPQVVDVPEDPKNLPKNVTENIPDNAQNVNPSNKGNDLLTKAFKKLKVSVRFEK